MRRLFAISSFLAVACLSAADPARSEFEAALLAAIKASGLDAGVAIKDLKSEEEFLVQPDVVFSQGSSIRIHLVTELFRQAAAGKLSLSKVRSLPESAVTGGSGVLRYLNRETVSMSLRDYAVMMIAVNDHSAANFLTDVLGMDNVNASLAAQGTPEIKLQHRVLSRRDYAAGPENVGTPRSVMRALELIHRGAVVDRVTSDAIIEVLSVPEVSYFRRDLPRGVMFAGRSGSGPSIRCDAGIVCLSERPFALCVMVKGLSYSGGSGYSKADALIANITQQAVRRYQPAGPDRRRKTSGLAPAGRYTTTSSSSKEPEFMLEKSSSNSVGVTFTEED